MVQSLPRQQKLDNETIKLIPHFQKFACPMLILLQNVWQGVHSSEQECIYMTQAVGCHKTTKRLQKFGGLSSVGLST